MPSDASRLVVSADGNDALQEKALIEESARSVAEVLDKLAKIKTAFAKRYGALLDGVLARKLPTAVSTATRRIMPIPPRARSRAWASRVQRRDHARGVRARPAADRLEAHHR